MNKVNIAIVGHGFVGKAVEYGFSTPTVDLTIIDPKEGTDITDLEDEQIDYAFVCVPTPMGDDGSINSEIVEECINFLKEKTDAIIILKSTVTPEIVADIVDRDSIYGHRVVYNPEFLVEKTANRDFVNPIMHVFGGIPETTVKVQELYEEHSHCNECSSFHMSAPEASFVKYGMNCFLASKVSWFNQFYDVIQNFGSDYNEIIQAIGHDDRIGHSHTLVPGFDGKRGFSGACFPKDTKAFYKFTDEQFSIMGEVIAVNNAYRRPYELDQRELEQNVKYD